MSFFLLGTRNIIFVECTTRKSNWYSENNRLRAHAHWTALQEREWNAEVAVSTGVPVECLCLERLTLDWRTSREILLIILAFRPDRVTLSATSGQGACPDTTENLLASRKDNWA
jgi:hypothetical protein